MRLFILAILCVFYHGVFGKVSFDIDMKLKAINKPALKTIKSEDGDTIDCVDIYKQHAFDHPALINHKIQMKPSVELGTTISNNGSSPVMFQIWSKSGSCPEGTIPVRRVNREEISRASSPSQFGRKSPHKYSFLDKANFNTTADKSNQLSPKDRSEAIVIAVGYKYDGAESDINVWNPPRVQAGDYSTAQIWLVGGLSSNSFESVEAGWMVNPDVFGDSRTRLFISWTRDAYVRTGCINLLCAGFVQTSRKVALGAALEPVSTPMQTQYTIKVSVYRDPNSRNWWLICANEVIGYWPPKIFSYLRYSAISVQWGGEVYSPNVRKKPHTKTAMGSGEWASYLSGNACYHTNIRIKDSSLQIKFPEHLTEYADEYDCYSTKLYYRHMSEPKFFFGGPGQSLYCP